MKILLLCVDYKTVTTTKKFLNSIRDTNYNYDVSLTCNSGIDGFEDYVDNNQVHIFDSLDNLGYMEGASQGFKNYLSSNAMPDWIILTNTDIEFDVNDTYNFLSKLEGKEILAPAITTLDGVSQNPFLVTRPKKRKIKFLKFVYSYKVLFIIYNLLSVIKSKLSKKLNYDKEQSLPLNIFAPHGAFVIFPKMYFEKGGDLTHPTFLYGEELIIAERAKSLNVPIVYCPEIKITHHEHVATASKGGVLKAKCLSNSLKYILKQYY